MSPNRREFLGVSCLGLFAAYNKKVFGTPNVTSESSRAMVKWTLDHLSEGYWSADALLLSAAKYLDEPQEIVKVATGFGEGLQQKDLCGFLTGGVMAIGLYAGTARGDDKAARERCHDLTKEYTEWWKSNFPLHCKDMSQPCDFKGMGQAASDFLQTLFEREIPQA